MKNIVSLRKNKKRVDNRNHEIWSINRADFSNYKISNNGYRYKVSKIDIFSKYTLCIPRKER